MALETGWAYKDPATKLIDWQTFQLTAPTLRQAPTYVQVTRSTVCACSENCGDFIVHSGTEAFPNEYIIDLGTDPGTVNFIWNAATAPGKFELEYDGVIIFSSGYRGDTGRQSELDLFLYTHSQPPETITTPISGSYSFPRGIPDSAIVRVYSPLYNNGYYFSVGCPLVSTTTTTSTSSSSSTSSSTTSSTTTANPLRSLTWEFRNPLSLGVKLTAVTVQDSASHELWSNELIDLTAALSEQRSESSALQTYSFLMTSVSDVNVTYNVYKKVDAGAEVLMYGPVNFSIGDTSGNVGFTNEGATTSIKYIVDFQ